MKIYNHGIPGIGITGQKGKNGKTGSGFYFGPLDSFFEFIGDDVLINSSIDYDDIDYDITYVQNEERLSHIYNTGDILYIVNDNEPKNILYMVEITDDLTTCTKEYFTEHIKHYKPFTFNFKINDNTIQYPINIVQSTNTTIDTSALFNLNKIYTNAAISIIYADNKYAEKKEIVNLTETDKTINPSDYSYPQIPYMYHENITKDEYINNGKDINHYTYNNPDNTNNGKILITLNAEQTVTDSLYNISETINNSLNIGTTQEKYITLSSEDNLYIKNLFIRTTNLGNIESYYTLFNQDIILDDNGNCYTLNETDFNPIEQSFIFDPSAFFRNRNHSQENYHFGYIHTFWNYTEDTSLINNNYYQPNYITGTLQDLNVSTIRLPRIDSFGNYIRDWENEKYNSVSNIPIKEQLINLWDCSTINDISLNLPESIHEEDIIKYKDYYGIILTDTSTKYLKYDYVKTLDGIEYRYYENNVKNLSYDSYAYEITLSKNPDIYQTYFKYNNKNTLNIFRYIYKKDTDSKIFLDTLPIHICKYNSTTNTFDEENDEDYYYELFPIYFKVIPLYNYDKSSIYIADINKSLNNIEDDHYEDLYTKEWFTTYSVDKDFLELYVQTTGALKILVKVVGPNGIILPIGTINYFILDENLDEEDINKYLYDSSYNSSIIYVQDPSDYKINLAINDKFNMPYRHHDIIQWIQIPNGFKYYSKHTYADYNTVINTYDISTNWDNTTIESQKYVDPAVISNINKLFDIQIINQNNNSILSIDTSTYGDQAYVRYIEVYQDSSLISISSDFQNGVIPVTVPKSGTITVDNKGVVKIPIILPKEEEQDSDDSNILNNLYLNKIKPSYDNIILFTIKYAIGNERTCSHIMTYEYNISGFNEYRTLPEIIFNTYNDMESLEKLNNADNGILCNQFQYFTEFKVNNFDNSNWGKVLQEYPNPKLNLKLTIKTIIGEIDKQYDNLDSILKISYSLIKPNIDIFKTSQKDLESENNIFDSFNIDNINDEYKRDTNNNKEYIIRTITGTIVFELNDLDDINDSYKLRILLETTNPTGIYYESYMYINELKITSKLSTSSSEKTFTLNPEYLVNDENILYCSSTIKSIICPISMIASYNQVYPKLSNINVNKWYGNEDEITVSLKPYKLNKAIEQYDTYLSRRNKNSSVNWTGLKYKMRYLQDNVKSINVEPININYIKDVLPERLYNQNYLVTDIDDIYDTYLEIIYNSNKLNPILMEDMEIIQYNNINYLSSQYGQYGNNTAVFIRQRIEHILRSDSLLNSMKAWNKLFETMKYESDNTYPGHEETYGNGYQYLPKSADTGQFLEDGLMLLENVKTINNNLFFDLTSNEYIEAELCKSSKYDEYTPSLYFRTLLYQMKWSYPKYSTKDGINIINTLPLVENPIESTNPDNKNMPYNLTYSIYPRVMFNDEEQINLVLMLRLPSIINEEQYEMQEENLNLILGENEMILDLQEPLNVMN